MISDAELRQHVAEGRSGDCGQWGADLCAELLACREALRGFIDDVAVEDAKSGIRDSKCNYYYASLGDVRRAVALLPEYASCPACGKREHTTEGCIAGKGKGSADWLSEEGKAHMVAQRDFNCPGCFDPSILPDLRAGRGLGGGLVMARPSCERCHGTGIIPTHTERGKAANGGGA